MKAPNGLIIEATSQREILDLISKGYAHHVPDKGTVDMDFESQLIAEWDAAWDDEILNYPDSDVDNFALGGGEDEE